MTRPANLWSFGGTELNAATYFVRTIEGYASIPPLRGGGVVLASVPGERFVGKLHAARKITLEIVLKTYPTNADIAIIHTNLDTLAKLFAVTDAESALVHHHPDGNDRTGYAHCAAWNPADHSVVGTIYLGTADFLMSDPYFYTTNIVKTGETGTYTVTHPGTARGHRSVFTFHGAATNPTITNTTNGLVLTYNGTLSGGDTVVIDCGAWTCTLNGANAIGNVVHAGDFHFMMIEPGANSLTLTGGGSVDHTFSPPWI